MKKIIAMLLMLSVLVCLAACETEPAQTSQPTESAKTPATEATVPALQDTVPAAPETYSFPIGDVELVPGAAFDAAALPEPVSVYQVPSCAIEGMDNVYSYGSYEITAFSDGKSESVYSIFLMEPDVATPEGLALGDEMAKAANLYGEYKEEGTAWVFTRQNTQLWVIGQDGVVISIEIRLVTE